MIDFRRVLQVLLPVAVVAIGVAGAIGLVSSREVVSAVEPPRSFPVIRIVEAQPTVWRARVRTHGTVQPATRSDVVAEVGGRVIEVGPSLAEGSFFAADEVLIRLDPRDYELALVEAKAAVAQAELAVELEQAEAESAKRAWTAMQRTGPPSALVLREPQLAEARARLEAAHARLESAERDIDRCVVCAPYQGRVLTKSIDLGQYVVRNTRLLQVYAIDAAEVRLPIRDSELEFLELEVTRAPGGEFIDAHGPGVELRAEFGGQARTWQGHIVRTEGQLDPQSRMVNLVARVEAPYASKGAGDTPLLINMFVEAEILGPEYQDVFVLPRSAMRGSSRVLVVDDDSRIWPREVDVLRMERDTVVVLAGLRATERVCVTPLEAVVDGMEVRIAAPPSDAEAGR